MQCGKCVVACPKKAIH
ncbi:4Fe-4S binding protein [Clostridium beijerinckii]|nr:4Fe-4S binding protein [Clostridium beijerinckii]